MGCLTQSCQKNNTLQSQRLSYQGISKTISVKESDLLQHSQLDSSLHRLHIKDGKNDWKRRTDSKKEMLQGFMKHRKNNIAQMQTIHELDFSQRNSQTFQAQQQEELRRKKIQTKCSFEFQYMLQKQPMNSQLDQSPVKLFLTIDELWLKHMVWNNIDINTVYRQLDDEPRLEDQMTQMVHIKRIGMNDKKVQMLFKQKVPMLGHFFYELELLAYNPKHKCQFTVGFIEYDKARTHYQSGQCLKQSYTYHEQQKNPNCQDKSKKINKKIRVQISRQEDEPLFEVYIDDENVHSDKLITEMWENSFSIVPFIETQHVGVEFGWRVPLDSRTQLIRTT